ncbi:AAA+ family ATPase [Yoonia sp. F2084L]|uniref:AAA+ family ATPase n=1 Tax=Yoonia sp. F2084L TaxID=2926419 RepID=UPI001FF42841|nr:AAA+ family ATPase [Yoonia sp. F2084L]MCK0096330.1 AAA+ family ATPase [Yoonia sp. F2084L]
MKQFIPVILSIGLLSTPAAAQEQSETDLDEGLSLMEEGARLLMRGLMTEMEPAIEGLRDTFDEMGPAFAEFAQTVGPAFAELLDQVDDLRNYEAPEFLPNGDIILRRSPDAPIWMPQDESGEIEL